MTTKTTTEDPAVTANNEAAAKRLADERQAQEITRAQFAARMKGKPTPTQEENDLAASGATFHMHEDDGSGPDPYAHRQMEAGEAAHYQTREHTAAQSPARHSGGTHSGSRSRAE